MPEAVSAGSIRSVCIGCFRGVLFKEGPPPWIATGALVPPTHKETPQCFLQPQTPPVTRALLGIVHDMAQAWSGGSSKKKGRREEWADGYSYWLDPGRIVVGILVGKTNAGGKCT